MAYSNKVLDHYNNPRNVGSLDKRDPNVGTGMVGAPECGDVMKLQLKVNPDSGIIEDAKQLVIGVLENQAGAGFHRASGRAGDLVTVDQDATFRDRQEAHQGLQQRGLACAVATEHRHALAGRELQAYVLERECRAGVAEPGAVAVERWCLDYQGRPRDKSRLAPSTAHESAASRRLPWLLACHPSRGGSARTPRSCMA